jgi:GT2 family glycosyltransferase
MHAMEAERMDSRAATAPVDCSVIIVNYRTETVLAECLASLHCSGGAESCEVIVVDNSATLAQVGFWERFPWVRFVENRRNLGFARASNQGLHLARGRHLLLLNPDTVVRTGSVGTLIQYLDAHPDVGAVGPRLLNQDGTLQYSCRRFPRWHTIFFGRYAFLTRLLPRNTVSRSYLYLDWDHESVAEVDWLTGACLMVRREVLGNVGPLDEGYFLFVEDMDWCRRIRDAAWKIAYVPDAIVTHHIGASRGPTPARLVWARHQSMFRYLRKHFGSPWPLEAAFGVGLLLRAGIEMTLNTLNALLGTVRLKRRADEKDASPTSEVLQKV